MAFELIDDWKGRQRAPRGAQAAPASARAMPLADGDAIEARLAALDLAISAVHCYEDVGYPWIQVSFDETISPAVALKIGEALKQAAGAETVYFNSLRPRAVYFLLEYTFDPPRELPASRYGETLAELKRAWGRSAG
jgi:hypothetical protein